MRASLLDGPTAFDVMAFGGGCAVVEGGGTTLAALAGDDATSRWHVVVDGVDLGTPWGVIVSRVPLEGALPGRGLVLTVLEPASSGGLLGLLGGAQSLLHSAATQRASQVLLRGAGEVHFDGARVAEGATSTSWLFELG